MLLTFQKKVVYKRKKTLNNVEKENFNKDLELILNRNHCFDANSPYTIDEQTTYLITSYQSLIDKYMPLKKLSKREKSFMCKPWITRGIRKSMAVRDKLRKKCLKSKSATVYKLFKDYRNIITRMKKISFNNYYKEKFQKNFGNKKREWEVINEITQYKKKEENQYKFTKRGKGH